MKILRETEEYYVLEKAAFEDSERDLPQDAFSVHRLDLPASGLLLAARSRRSAAKLSEQLRNKSLQKRYLAAIEGKLPEEQGEMTDFLYRDRRKQKMFPVKKLRQGVKEARLRYRLWKSIPLAGEDAEQEAAVTELPAFSEPEEKCISIYEVELFTGRFHQIRAQFAGRKHPLLCDHKYGSRVPGKGIALFCTELQFQDPVSGESVTVHLEPPESFPVRRKANEIPERGPLPAGGPPYGERQKPFPEAEG